MKNLDLIEDEYKIAFEEVVEKYRDNLKKSPDHAASKKEFSKSFHKILKKRNKDFSNYIKKNKDKLLDMPEKKVKVSKEMGVYKAYNFNFNPTFREKFMQSWKRFSFKLLLTLRSVKYNIVPSWLKLSVFKIGRFFSSMFFDMGNVRRFLGRRINFFMGIHMSKLKERVMVVVNWGKAKFSKFEEWKKKKIEERKKRAEAIEAKKKAKEEAEKETDDNDEPKEEKTDNENESLEKKEEISDDPKESPGEGDPEPGEKTIVVKEESESEDKEV